MKTASSNRFHWIYFFLGFASAWMIRSLLEIRKTRISSFPLPESPSPAVAASLVDEASWESFPGSDAPGWRP